MNFDPSDISIHYEPPVSYANDIEVKEVLTINEQRRMLDEDLPMLEHGDLFVADREVIVTERQDDEDDDETAETADEEKTTATIEQ